MRRKTFRFLLGVAMCLLLMIVMGRSASAQTFQHPGVLVSQAQLDFIKDQVNKGIDPIHAAFVKAQNSTYGSLTYTPQGPPSGGTIDCGSFSNPDIGCSAEDEDGTAAYTQALLFWITGNTTYAQNAITILNAYGHNLKNYTNSNGPLQAAWGGSKWARAAEIIRSSNAGWAPADAQAFGAMMNNAILPMIQNGSGNNGNWELSMIEAMIGIAVYNDDTTLFNHAVTFWHQRVPAYFYYFPSDGNKPVPAPRGSTNWNGQTVFNATVNGVAQETCRDFGHTEFGIAATMAAAETAHIQGTDLFGSEKPRLEAALEFHAHYLLGNTVPNSVCGGKVTLAQRPTFEIGYNDYHNRLGDSLPDTLKWLQTNVRTLSLPVDHHMMVFETLTHGADAGAVGPQPDFSIAASPSTQTVNAGSSTTYAVSIGALAGFTGTVTLAVGGLPSGATGTFNPATISGAGSSTLTISTASSAPSSTSTLSISGNGGGKTHSQTVSLSVSGTAPPPPSCITAGSTWQDTELGVTETGSFTVTFDATPSANKINSVIAISSGAQTAYTGFATLARFNPSGDIDARDGGSYAAASTIPYSGGTAYHFRMVIDIPSHTYSIFVTAPGGTEQTVGSDFAFRSEQSGVSSLDWWGVFAETGQDTVCNFTVQ